MKVLALNSSPRGEGQSQTEFLLNLLVQGMQEAGADVEVVALRKKKIKHCIGCFTCWTKTPGHLHSPGRYDQRVVPKWLAADVVVYATPLYHYTVNATMKAFIERTLPVLHPFFRTTRRAKPGILSEANLPRRSCCRWPVFPNDPYLICSPPGSDSFSAEMEPWSPKSVGRRPRPARLSVSRKRPGRFWRPFVRRGGKLLNNQPSPGNHGIGSTRTLSRIKEALAQMANLFWKTCIAEKVSPREFDERGLMPRPDSVKPS